MMIRPHKVILLRQHDVISALLRQYDVISAGRAMMMSLDVIISKATSIHDVTEGLIICGFLEN